MKLTIKQISWASLIMSLLGLADSIYLTIAHYTTPAILACPATKFINCEKVTSSSYSMVFGVPITFFGIAFFVLLTVLSLPKFWLTTASFIKKLRILSVTLGMVGVFYLVYVELYKINSICLYCTGVHILTFLLFVITIYAHYQIAESTD